MRYSDPDERRRQFEASTLSFMPALYNTALRLTPDADAAADAVQDTYLRAYRTFDNFLPGTNAKAWLFTILYSVIINRRDKARREVGPLPPDEIEAHYQRLMEASGDQPDALIREWDREVETALRALPPAFRNAVILVDIEDLSYEEAARALDCPVGTVQSRLFRGRRLLYAALEQYARRAGYLRSVER